MFPLFSILTFFRIINAWPKIATTTDFLNVPSFFNFNVFTKFGRKFQLPQNFSIVPSFFNFHVFRIINVWPEIPTTTEVFECPVFSQLYFFLDYSRLAGNSNYHLIFQVSRLCSIWQEGWMTFCNVYVLAFCSMDNVLQHG